jgi:cupin fold WbuC family metalloprotein
MNHDIFSSVDEQRLNTLFLQAERADSRRAHLLLHRDAADPVQRLLVALNPGTYIPPQRHLPQWELQLLVFGSSAM